MAEGWRPDAQEGLPIALEGLDDAQRLDELKKMHEDELRILMETPPGT